MKTIFWHLFVLALICGSGPSNAAQQSDAHDPEYSTQSLKENTQNVQASKSGVYENAIVVTANPLATEAGLKILQSGGNAIDAMVAVQLVLGLVEPQSSGLGGGAFTLLYDAKANSVRAFDGRETAPLAAPDDLFLTKDETPMGFFEAVVGGRSVGTPGTVALLWHMHREKGQLSWSKLFEPAKQLAEQGFTVSPRLAESVARDQKRLASDETTAQYFLPEGTPIQVGKILKNPAYLKTLRALQKHGAQYFYTAPFAQAIVDKVTSSKNPGYLSLKDFAAYKVVEREPVCSEIFGYQVCGMGPPSSGALTVNQTLLLAEQAMPNTNAPESATAWHIIAEASRRAFADRNRYIADTDFIDMPEWLLNENYLNIRASEISPERRSEVVEAGRYEAATSSHHSLRSGIELEQPSTTHFVIVDQEGNVISTTSTIENGFGSRLMVNGFLLNNELTDFSFARENDDGLIANRVEPGKRPRSSMAPTIVLFKDQPVLAIGSPGGSRIINYVANSLLRVLLWEQDVRDVVKAPHFSNRSGPMDIEASGIQESTILELEALGYQVNRRDLNSGLHAVQWVEGKLVGAADPRREGSVLGF